MKQTQTGFKPGRALRSAQKDLKGKKMSTHIPEDILKQTTRCKKNFYCLPNGEEHLCKVSSFIDNKVCVVECSNEISCTYKIPFGNSIICTCPLRAEIYRQYGI